MLVIQNDVLVTARPETAPTATMANAGAENDPVWPHSLPSMTTIQKSECCPCSRAASAALGRILQQFNCAGDVSSVFTHATLRQC